MLNPIKATALQQQRAVVGTLERERAAARHGPGPQSAAALSTALQATYAKQEVAKWETAVQKANKAVTRMDSLIGLLGTPEGPKPKELAKIAKAYADVIRAFPPPQEK